MQEKTILNVKFKDKELAKSLGARWNIKDRTWYLDEYLSKLKIIQKWFPESEIIQKNIDDDEIVERFYKIPCRFKTGKEILVYLGVKRKDIKEDTGFCIMCDSDYIERYILKEHKIELHHLWDAHTDKELSAREEYLLYEYLDSSSISKLFDRIFYK